jgi:hypothetical protein
MKAITIFEPAIDVFPKPDESNPHSHILFFKIRFNITLPSTPRSSKPYLFIRFFDTPLGTGILS